MVDLASQQLLPRLRSPAFGGITRNFRSAEYSASRILDRRDSQRNFDQRAVFALPYRFVVRNALAAPDGPKNTVLLVVTIQRDDDEDGFAKDFGCLVAKEALSPLVPGLNDSIQIFADDGVFRRIDNGCEAQGRHLRLFSFTDVNEHVHSAGQIASRIEKGRWVWQKGYARTFACRALSSGSDPQKGDWLTLTLTVVDMVSPLVSCFSPFRVPREGPA